MSLLDTVQQEVVERLGNLSVTARQAVESVLPASIARCGGVCPSSSPGTASTSRGTTCGTWTGWSRPAATATTSASTRRKRSSAPRSSSISPARWATLGPKSTKLEYARALAAALGFLMVRQNDAVGLVTCDTRDSRFPPGQFDHGPLPQCPGRARAHRARQRDQPGARPERKSATVSRAADW